MFVGHYLAWVCAGVMGAAAAFVARKPLTQLDSGDVASQALGVSGALAVVIAGWTTANPTLYRAGLALQVVTPNWPRWAVTLIAGVITTLMACSPFVFTRLLDFVGTYGLLLMPVGAIVFVEHWVFPRIGFTQFWASRKGLAVSWPALVAWLGSVALAVVVWQSGWIHLFFLALPVWVVTAVAYTALSAVAGARAPLPPEPAKTLVAAAAAREATSPVASGPRSAAWTVSGVVTLATLASLVLLPAWVLRAEIADWPSRLNTFKAVALALTAIYFVAGTVWMNENEKRRGGVAG
jgi:NCS1 family nucleobase:cation symporter-1